MRCKYPEDLIMDMSNIPDSNRICVPGGFGKSITAKRGQYIAVVDLYGGQCGDFWSLDINDLDHFLSPMHSWIHTGTIYPQVGDELVTNRREPILTIIADDVGWHDMLAPACDRQRYERYYGVADHRNCCDNFREAMSESDWGNRLIPQPFNLFMNTFVEPDGKMIIRDPISKTGDKIIFRAEKDIIVVVSACPMDLNPVGGESITDLEIMIAISPEAILAGLA
jgi:uncharacterized protein YcgI (DUF1989 family)